MKRYVLLEDKSIYDTKETNMVQAGIRIMPDKSKKEYINGKKVLKYADNILDLVEVGDMVEIEDVGICFINRSDKKDFYRNMVSVKVEALWKRQGDTFKRYEVGEK